MEVLDMKAPGFRDDPHSHFKRVREAGPLCRVEPFNMIGVTRYADVVAVLKNPQLFSSYGIEEKFPPLKGAEAFARGNILIGNDPPAHTRVRRLIQRAFTIPSMHAWEPRVEALTTPLVDALIDKESFDLIADLAMPLPVQVISAMLGVDSERQLDFKRWSDDMLSIRTVQVSEPSAWRTRREKDIIESANEYTAYFEGVIAKRRKDPSGDDLITAMVRAGEEGQILQPAGVFGLTRLMLVAGNETTTNLLGNAMTALLKHRDQWEALVKEPELAKDVTEEILRYDGPVLQLSRRTTQDTEIGEEPVPEGTFIAPLLASANRDPRQFSDPDTFNIRRRPQDHIAFGAGVHLCVGAPLARIELRIALQQLAKKLPHLELVDHQPQWLDSLAIRGYRSLPLRQGR